MVEGSLEQSQRHEVIGVAHFALPDGFEFRPGLFPDPDPFANLLLLGHISSLSFGARTAMLRIGLVGQGLGCGGLGGKAARRFFTAGTRLSSSGAESTNCSSACRARGRSFSFSAASASFK